MRTFIAGCALAFLLSGPAYAQVQRLLPGNGKRGDLVSDQQQLPVVRINNKALRLSPGVLIYDQNNRTILLGALPERADVLYVLDASGNVRRLYLLTRDEQARLDQAGVKR